MAGVDFFLCHTKRSTRWECNAFVHYQLHQALTEKGYKTFFDRVHLPGGTIEQCIIQARGARVVIAVLDDEFPTPWCFKELEAATAAGVIIQPLWPEDRFKWDEVGKPVWWKKEPKIPFEIINAVFARPAIPYNRDPIYAHVAAENMIGVLEKCLSQVDETLPAHLKKMTLKDLKKRFLAMGGDRVTVEEADGREDPKSALIGMILRTEENFDVRRQLQQLKLTDLEKRAAAAGAAHGDIDDAKDDDNPKQALVDLILLHEAMKLDLVPGTRVQCHGLKTSKYNDMHGALEHFHQDVGHGQVEFDSGERVKIKPENLKVQPQAPSDVPPDREEVPQVAAALAEDNFVFSEVPQLAAAPAEKNWHWADFRSTFAAVKEELDGIDGTFFEQTTAKVSKMRFKIDYAEATLHQCTGNDTLKAHARTALANAANIEGTFFEKTTAKLNAVKEEMHAVSTALAEKRTDK